MIDIENGTGWWTKLPGISFEKVNVASAPAGMPDIGIAVTQLVKVTTTDENSDWWRGMTFKNFGEPAITTEHNSLNFLVYTTSTVPDHCFNGFLFDAGYILFANWKKQIKPNQWQIITIDLSDPMYAERKLSELEFCIGAAGNAETYILPYWGTALTYTAGVESPLITWGEEGNYFSTYYPDEATANQRIEEVDLSTLPDEVKNNFPGTKSQKIFRIQTNNVEWQWPWNSTLNFWDPIEIIDGKSVLSYWVYTPGDMINILVQSETGNDGGLVQLPNDELFRPTPNQWFNIRENLTNVRGQKISKIQICPEVPNITLYLYPYWESTINTSVVAPQSVNNKPYISNGVVKI
ncbi:MAG: hypothetical protein PHG06_21980, partial [Parabacteroides sp.]|nr:hypothetical protein [Parabacteroides sp.]